MIFGMHVASNHQYGSQPSLFKLLSSCMGLKMTTPCEPLNELRGSQLLIIVLHIRLIVKAKKSEITLRPRDWIFSLLHHQDFFDFICPCWQKLQLRSHKFYIGLDVEKIKNFLFESIPMHPLWRSAVAQLVER